MTPERERIYDELIKHPKAMREVVELSRNMSGENPLDSTRTAQEMCVEYVEQKFGGDVNAFLTDYSKRHTREARTEIITFAGRKELGL